MKRKRNKSVKCVINTLDDSIILISTSVKQSLEDEGATFEDIELMRKITSKAGVDLNVKIGGCEAKNDIYFCKQIRVNSIVAPMVESEYALRKFIQVAYDPKDKFTKLFRVTY